MKDKLSSPSLTKEEKMQILTAPHLWSRWRIAEEFNVSEYIVWKARNLVTEKGIFAVPESKKGRKISAETMSAAENFYQDDGYSIMMPGAKDKISIKKNEYHQKRFILGNLNQGCYLNNTTKFPDHFQRKCV